VDVWPTGKNVCITRWGPVSKELINRWSVKYEWLHATKPCYISGWRQSSIAGWVGWEHLGPKSGLELNRSFQRPGQISSWPDLKRWSLRLFEECHPTRITTITIRTTRWVPGVKKHEKQTGNCFCSYRPRSHLSQVCWHQNWNLPQWYSLADTEVVIHTGENSDIMGSASDTVFSVNNFTHSMHRKAAFNVTQCQLNQSYTDLSSTQMVVILDGGN